MLLEDSWSDAQAALKDVLLIQRLTTRENVFQFTKCGKFQYLHSSRTNLYLLTVDGYIQAGKHIFYHTLISQYLTYRKRNRTVIKVEHDDEKPAQSACQKPSRQEWRGAAGAKRGKLEVAERARGKLSPGRTRGKLLKN